MGDAPDPSSKTILPLNVPPDAVMAFIQLVPVPVELNTCPLVPASPLVSSNLSFTCNYDESLKDVEIFGPAIAPISRIKNKTRVRLLIKSSKFTKISQIEIRDWLKSISVPNNIYFSVDIDPYNFY